MVQDLAENKVHIGQQKTMFIHQNTQTHFLPIPVPLGITITIVKDWDINSVDGNAKL
jgi:hypothetical protein